MIQKKGFRHMLGILTACLRTYGMILTMRLRRMVWFSQRIYPQRMAWSKNGSRRCANGADADGRFG